MTRAAVYVRISKDDTGERAGVQRQREDCLALAESRGWEVVEVFEDNDVSAAPASPENSSTRSHRPATSSYCRGYHSPPRGRIWCVFRRSPGSVIRHGSAHERHRVLVMKRLTVERLLRTATEATKGSVELHDGACCRLHGISSYR